MTKVHTMVNGGQWEAMTPRQRRETFTQVVTSYKPDGVTELVDDEGSWTCVFDGCHREQPRDPAATGHVDVEVVIGGVVRCPTALVTVEQLGDELVCFGRGPMAGVPELRGFAALLANHVDPSASRHLGMVVREELGVGRGSIEDGPDRGVWHEVLDHALRVPSRIAIEDGARTTSYEQLARHAVHNAQLIAGRVAVGDTVAVAIDRGTSSVVAQLAAFLAGCPIALIDPALPPTRIQTQLEHSATRLVMAAPDDVALREVTSLAGARFMTVDLTEDGGPMNILAEIQCAPPLDADATSHVAFTSGSTGSPKAVALRHGPMANTAIAIVSAAGLTESSRASWFCPPGVGLVEVDLFPSLWVGATVVVAPDTLGRDPRKAWAWMRDHNISHAQLPTALAEHLIKLDASVPLGFESLRVAGERLSVWPSAGAGYKVLNVYGSTEANVVSVCDATRLVQELPRDRLATVPIGHPVRNVNMYVLDEELRPVARRVVGELCISGRSVSRGYLGDGIRQREKFVPNPIDSDPFPVLYRSGDLARFGADGMVEVVGRIDDEIKVDGVRVHPGEVEHELLAIEVIVAAAVVAHELANGPRTLVAYVDGGDVDVVQVRSHLETRLPSASVPRHIIIGELPTGRNGKIDRASLSCRPLDRPDLNVPFSMPRTGREEELCALFAEVLGLETVGADDDFFELGGGSLQAARLIERSENQSGVELDFVMLVDHPSPRQLASAL